MKEKIERAASYVLETGLHSVGLGYPYEDFKYNPRRLQEAIEQTSNRSGLHKLTPIISYASGMLLLSANELVAPLFARGLSASTIPEHDMYTRDLSVVMFGIIPDVLTTLSLSAIPQHPEVLAIKLLYNAAAHVVLDVIGVPSLHRSFLKHIPT